MPNIPITAGLNLTADAQLAPWSSLLKYVPDIPKLVVSPADFARWQLLTLSDPAVTKLDAGLAFEKPVALAAGATKLTFGASAGGRFSVLTGAMFAADVYGDNIAIPAGQCAVKLGFTANAGVGADVGAGAATFGLHAAAGIAIDSYRTFPSGTGAPTVLDALRTCIGEFVIPVNVDDVAAVPAGVVVTLEGHGSLKFSASANLLAIANPLASVALPAPLPALSVKQGGSIDVGASWEITAEYQIRVQKLDTGRVRLGWYRKHTSEFTVTASASAGIAAGIGTTDLFPMIVGAISPDATGVGVLPEVEAAVKKAVSRKLELALAAEFGSLSRDEAAFLYELDLDAIDNAARDAVGRALHGDLTGLADTSNLPAGVTAVRSILTRAAEKRFVLKINLLGIFNVGSVSKLALEGVVTYTPSTGEVVIVDQATAERIGTTSINFGPNEQKLRQAMAESFLITAAYRGSGTATAPPELASRHSFFRLDNGTNADEMLRFTMALATLNLPVPAPPAGIADFGRTTLHAEAAYQHADALALFLRTDSTARPIEDYETAGRQAIRHLVPAGADDDYRLRPATDDALWDRMKDQGPANFLQFFPAPQDAVVRADYLTISWWAEEMRATAVLVERILRPGAANAQALREDLAKHFRGVASRAREEFGAPWGLLAMYLVSGGTAATTGSITSPRLVFAAG